MSLNLSIQVSRQHMALLNPAPVSRFLSVMEGVGFFREVFMEEERALAFELGACPSFIPLEVLAFRQLTRYTKCRLLPLQLKKRQNVAR